MELIKDKKLKGKIQLRLTYAKSDFINVCKYFSYYLLDMLKYAKRVILCQLFHGFVHCQHCTAPE